MSTRDMAITVAVLLAFPVLVGPIVIGLMLERGSERFSEAAAGAGVRMQFDRGLYASRVVTHLAFKDDAGNSGRLVIEHDIIHGPIPLAAPAYGLSPFDLAIVLVRSRVDPDPEAMPGVAAALGGASLATVVTRVGSTGNVDARIESPGFELEGQRLIWAGLEGEVVARDRGSDVRAQIAAAGLRLADAESSLTLRKGVVSFSVDAASRRITATLEQDGGEWVTLDRRIELGPLQVEADQPLGGPLLADSRSVWSFSRIAGGGGLGESDYEVTGLEIGQSVVQDPASGLHRGELEIAFERWVVDDAAPDGPARFDLVLDRVDRAAVERFRAAMQALEQSGQSPEEIEAMRPFVVLEQMPSLLASSPVAELEEAWIEGAEGRATAQVRLSVDGSEPELLSDPFMMLSLLMADAKLDGPEPLVRRMADRLLPTPATAPPVALQPEGGAVVSDASEAGPPAAAAPPPPPADPIDVWLEEGKLVRVGDRLRFDAHFEDGLPMLNGAPADPELFMSLMPGM